MSEEKTWDHPLSGAPRIARFVIHFVAWTPPAPHSRGKRRAEAELAVARAKASEDMALITAQKLEIAKLQRRIYGQKSERSARLIDQLALGLEELEANATEDELAAEQAVAKTTTVARFERKRPQQRDTFPEHLPRERVVIEPPTACACCGGARLRKLGEDVTRTLESTPRQWKVIETVRESSPAGTARRSPRRRRRPCRRAGMGGPSCSR